MFYSDYKTHTDLTIEIDWILPLVEAYYAIGPLETLLRFGTVSREITFGYEDVDGCVRARDNICLLCTW